MAKQSVSSSTSSTPAPTDTKSPVMAGWIQTFGGRAFRFQDPRPSDISPIDIAHALAMKCRFGGHCRSFYSVAEHSARVAWLVDHRLKKRFQEGGFMGGISGPIRQADTVLWALLHDAAEAYLPDIPRPVKQSGLCDKLNDLETRILEAVAKHFGLSWPVDPSIAELVKACDNAMLATERRDLMAPNPAGHDWVLPEPAITLRITPWEWESAKFTFTRELNRLRLALNQAKVAGVRAKSEVASEGELVATP